jgi:rubredoxin
MVRQQDVKNPGRLKALERFEILYTADFNPNTLNLVSYRKDVKKEYLGTYLVSLCKYFYERESQEKSPSNENVSHALNPVTAKKSAAIIHRCKHCFTIYDEALGEVENNVAAGTPFINLPQTYQCQLCEAGKEDFQPLDQNSLKQVGS